MNKNIYMIYGSNFSFMTKRLLESIDVYSQIGAKEKRIVIKPNLVIAGRPDEGATTHTEIMQRRAVPQGCPPSAIILGDNIWWTFRHLHV